MSSLYSQLAWLPRVHPEFARELKSLNEGQGPYASDLQHLASHALDLNQLIKLARVKARIGSRPGALRPMVQFRLAVLSNSTIDLIAPAIIASSLRYGIDLEIIQAPYDQIAQEALRPDSSINSAGADAVLFAFDYRALPIKPAIGDEQGAAQVVQAALAYVQALTEGIKANTRSVCMLQTFAPPPEPLFGNADRGLPGTLINVLARLNQDLADHARSSGDLVLDVSRLAEIVGLANWHDPQLWNMAKLPFSDEFIPFYADQVARLIAAIRGKSRKVLILDLDNTVWGGVIGDDGLEGIKIAQGDAAGEAHLAVQRLALDLRQRGIVLAVSSKNTDAIARTPFEQHPEMLLKLEHIAVFQANWNDKATNIRAIANELSLGLDSMVFLDDNPAERGLVRRLLPQVAVPELPEDPALFARTLAAAGYFEAVTFASEDLQRAGFYQENAKRAVLQKQVGGVEAYLESLEMVITFQPFDATGRARIVQLINKSNQYNLTTRRYTEPEVLAAELQPDVFTLQVRLTDIFGDNGMISVVICRCPTQNVWEIDTWLMSCRVLGRKVESMVLGEILKHAARADIATLIGVYHPTERNQMVADHYEKLGFTKTREQQSGMTRWELRVADAVPDVAPMKVISQGFRSEARLSGEAAPG